MGDILYKKVIVPASALVGHDGHFPEVQRDRYLGGKLRMDAAIKIAEDNPKSTFVLIGGYSILEGKVVKNPDQVDDMARFMSSNLPGINLELVRTLPCTHHNFIGLLNTWANKAEHPVKVGILTNEYHMERTVLFARQASRAVKWPIVFEPLVVENILEIDIHAYIQQHGYQKAYENRIALERQGMSQLKDGTYQDPCFGRNFTPLLPLMREQGIILLTEEERISIASMHPKHDSSHGHEAAKII